MRDEWFYRGDEKVPMTKEEIRAVSLSRLDLGPSDILWDIGSGTGSVSIEAAVRTPGLTVTAFERNPAAVSLMAFNLEKAGKEGLLSPGGIRQIEGDAPEAFAGAEQIPTAAFIGGSGGSLGEILEALYSLNPAVRITANVITLESLQMILEVTKRKKLTPLISLIQVSRVKGMGESHLLIAGNPVYVVSF